MAKKAANKLQRDGYMRPHFKRIMFTTQTGIMELLCILISCNFWGEELPLLYTDLFKLISSSWFLQSRDFKEALKGQ